MNRHNLTAIFSGSGLGLAVGLFMGLSVSPIVGVVIGAIASSLAVFLGFGDEKHTSAKSLRIGAFGLAAALSAILGIYIRSHNLLSPSLDSLKSQYLELGFSEEEALSFIKFKEFGILNEDWNIAGGDSAALTRVNAGTSLLFSSGRVSRDKCDKFDFTEDTPLRVMINNLKFLDEDWKEMTEEVVEMYRDEDEQRAMLMFLSGYICDDRVDDSFGKELLKIDDQSNLRSISKAYMDIGSFGEEIVSEAAQLPDQKAALLLLKNALSHEE